jgi:hypothetical protein
VLKEMLQIEKNYENMYEYLNIYERLDLKIKKDI